MASAVTLSSSGPVVAAMAGLARPAHYGGSVPEIQSVRRLVGHEPLATVVYAYYAVHRDLRTSEVEFSLSELESLIERGLFVGAAGPLSVDCDLFLRSSDDFATVRAEYLESAARAEPGWANPWHYLAWSQLAREDQEGALRSLERARANLVDVDQYPTGPERDFESLFTGRVSSPAQLDAEIEEARARP